MADIYFDVDTALSEVPVNIFPLTDDTDFKTRETAVAYNASGMDLVWNFVTTAGAFTQTAVTPTTGGAYDWTHQGDGMYTIEIPASGGASINNDTEGFGWFTGLATGVLPWRSPVFGFRAASVNDALIDGGDILDVSVIQIAGSSVSTSSAQLGVNVVNVGGTAQTANDMSGDVDTLLSRIVGTLASGTHNPQSGDAYPIVNSGTYGNAALNSDLDTLLTRISANAALNSDMQTLLARITAAVALNSDIQTLLTRIGTPEGASIAADIGTRLPTTSYTTPPTVVQIRQEMDSNSTQLTAIVADTNELQTDFHTGGRLDVKLDEAKNTGVLKVWNGTTWS